VEQGWVLAAVEVGSVSTTRVSRLALKAMASDLAPW
jgi:hypothetical protein